MFMNRSRLFLFIFFIFRKKNILCGSDNSAGVSNMPNVLDLSKNIDYLECMPIDIQTFLKKHNLRRKQHRNPRWQWGHINLYMDEIISLFSDIIIRDVFERALSYKMSCKAKKYIRFSLIDDPLKMNEFLHNALPGYFSSSKKVTYNWLRKLKKECAYNTDNIKHISGKHRALFFSQVRPVLEEINLIWNVYKKIKNYYKKSDALILIHLTLGDDKGCKIRNHDKCKQFTEINISISNNLNYTLCNSIQLRGNYDKDLEDEISTFFYGIYLKEVDFGFELLLNSSVLNISLKSKRININKNKLILIVRNKVTQKTHRISFSFFNLELTKVTLDREELELKPSLVGNLFISITKVTGMPFYDFASMYLWKSNEFKQFRVSLIPLLKAIH